MSKHDIDRQLSCGVYQCIHYCVYQLITILLACNMAFMVFGKVVPKWSCLEWNVNSTLFEINGTASKNACLILNTGVLCKKYNWETDFYSIVPEWNLICGRSRFVVIAMSVQMAGVLIGSPLGGQLSDWLGRKWVLFGSTLMLILTGASSAWSPNMETFTIIRFFIGFFCGAVIVVNYVYMNEFLISKHRLWVNSMGGWPLGFACLAYFAWLTRDWSKLSLLCNLLAVPCLPLLFFMKESPHWSIQKGREEDAEKCLKMVAKLNKVKIPKSDTNKNLLEPNTPEIFNNESSMTVDIPRKRKVYGFWNLFTTRQFCLSTIALSICFFCISAISYGIIFDSDKLVGDRYVNFFILAFLRCISSALTIAADKLIKSCGRKLTFILPTSLVGLCCICITVSKIIGYQKTVITVLALVASMMTSPVWIAISLSNAEIYPTAIRNVAMGFTAMFNRLGGVITPLILYLSDIWPQLPLPYLIFGILAFISSILYALIIPETKNRALPTEMDSISKDTELIKT